MYRDIDNYLQTWRQSSARKPLILRGARQVGKTYAVKHLAASSYSKFAHFDFEQKPQLRRIFEQDYSLSRILPMLELEAGCAITGPDTLVFFDEIQACPRALAALRYFFEDRPDIHIIAAGSLLEFTMEKLSFPVGRVEFAYMYPCTFQEFLVATDNTQLNELRPTLDESKPVEAFIHHKLLEALRTYFVVGGMPEALAHYIATHSFTGVAKIHAALNAAYLQDLLKYERKLDYDALAIILKTVTTKVGSTLKYSALHDSLSTYKIKQALSIFEKAMLMHWVLPSSAQGLPLSVSIKNQRTKPLALDIGLMQHMCGIPANESLLQQDLTAIHHGSVAEQFIGQELLARNVTQEPALYYWHRNAKNSNAEIDYLMVRDGHISPVEVKSGPSGRLRSLHLFLQEHQNISNAYVLNTSPASSIGNIQIRPLYSKLF